MSNTARWWYNHPECKSRVVYKGALDGKRALHMGRQRADRARARHRLLLNRNLLTGAIADSEPNLEIENAIIGAGHASSVGRFDDEELSLPESRGISVCARSSWCGFGELVEEIGIPAISEHLMNVIDKRLAAAKATRSHREEK
ncbi:MAG: SufD family Fe-S cluster assembly protein [Bifidobacterium breve]